MGNGALMPCASSSRVSAAGTPSSANVAPAWAAGTGRTVGATRVVGADAAAGAAATLEAGRVARRRSGCLLAAAAGLAAAVDVGVDVGVDETVRAGRRTAI
jgi:hypothetical protein